MTRPPDGVWRPVVGFESAYWVSSDGRVWSVPRERTRGGLLTRHMNADYPTVHLGRARFVAVHRVVAEAFLGPLPTGMVTRHLDGDSMNCDLSNLRYGTPGENMLDEVRHGTHANAAKKFCKHGHEFTPANTYRRPGKPERRYCAKCIRIHNVETSAKRRAHRASHLTA